jgi:putative FmdB family regulatory protein
MPFYDFACECGNEFNVMAKMKELEDKSIKCPECGSTELKRIYGNINFIREMGKSEPACPHAHVCGAHCRH